MLQGPNASGGQRYASLTVRVKRSVDVEPVENEIKKMGYRTFSLFDASRNLRLLFALLDLLLGIFGSLALAVATLGIVNTLVMAILERRRALPDAKAESLTTHLPIADERELAVATHERRPSQHQASLLR